VKSPPWRKFLRASSMQRDFEEIRALAVKYIKEETVQPIKELGRFVAYGTLGSVFVGFGVTLLLLGALRFLQEQFKVLDGSLSWLPYLIVVALAAVVVGFTAWRIVGGAPHPTRNKVDGNNSPPPVASSRPPFARSCRHAAHSRVSKPANSRHSPP
jgi:hypothetical protein